MRAGAGRTCHYVIICEPIDNLICITLRSPNHHITQGKAEHPSPTMQKDIKDYRLSIICCNATLQYHLPAMSSRKPPIQSQLLFIYSSIACSHDLTAVRDDQTNKKIGKNVTYICIRQIPHKFVVLRLTRTCKREKRGRSKQLKQQRG